MNVSKQLMTTASEDAASMYLSFDETLSESNVSYKSTATYANECEKDDSNGNTTLEPQKDDDLVNTMKDVLESSSDLSSALAPLRLQPAHILRDFKALSSTPSKVDEDHGDYIGKSGYGVGLEAERRFTLSNVFENLVSKFEQSLNGDNICDKENKPISSDDSMPSFSKTSLIELQKTKIENENSSSVVQIGKFHLKAGNNIIGDSIEINSSNMAVGKKAKMNTAVRKSLCEPNLQTNRPSRIVGNKKTRYSHLNGNEGINVANTAKQNYRSFGIDSLGDRKQLNPITEAYTLSQKAAKLSAEGNKHAVKPSRKTMGNNKAANIARRSVLPNLSSEIRYAPQRISSVVKTTLNSSTRKATRKSNVAPSNTVSKRRSVLLLQSKLASPLPNRKKIFPRSSYTTSSDDHDYPIARAVGGDDVGTHSPTIRSVNGRRTMYIEKPDVKFTCTECGQYYNVRSLLDAHKRTHHVTSPETQKHRALATGASTSANNAIAASNTSTHTCKYCDKGFAIERALHIHLLEHCQKIPASERRKLEYTELDHVNKAETPHFRLGQTRIQRKVISTPVLVTKNPLGNLPVKKINEDKIETNFELLNKKKKDGIANKDEKSGSTSEHSTKQQMAPPILTKLKKKPTAHAGVYRTPNKEIPCLSCKQSFKNIIDYTNHMMTAHKPLNGSNCSVDNQTDH